MKIFSLSVLTGKSIRICLILLFPIIHLSAQSVTNYAFVGSNGTFTPLATPNATSWTGSTDDGTSALIPIGFDFWYMGVRYTNIGATTNGWITLGAVATNSLAVNKLSTGGAPRPVIAPLWDDLDLVAFTNATYKTTGTVGSRIFTMEFLNMKWNYLALGAVCSFQVKLFEGTGKVEFVYRSDAFSSFTPSASIGITAAATGSGNYLSVNNNGTSVSSASEANVTSKRTTGRTYDFTPPVPVAPGSLTFTNVSSTAMTLNWTDLSSNETGFVIYSSTDGVNYSFVRQMAAGSTSSLQSGLTIGTTYFWKVYAVTEGGLSTPLSGSQATLCLGPVISQLPASNLIAYYKFEGNANDATGNDNGTFQGGTPAQAADRFNISNKAYTFNGSSNEISTANAYVNPSAISVAIWFKTTTTVGGVLIGFSSTQTGGGGNRDRMIYMTATGALYLGVAPGSVKKYISTAAVYNDGNWHHAVGTLGAGGLKLYVDGALVASDATVTSAESYTGYWRIGYDDITTWPAAPSSFFFQGTLDDAIVYQRELNSTEVSIIFSSPDGAGSNAPVCAGSPLNLTATTVAGSTYSWTGPNGFSSAVQNPTLTFSAAYAGVYTLQVTNAGCSTPSVAYVNVTATGSSGQWTGNTSTDWATAGNWCDGVVPGATTDVTISSGATRMPTIGSSVNCNSLTIANGATLTLGSAGTLNVAGTLTNNGTFINNGTVNFNGTNGQQTFSGVPAFYNLTLNNSAGLLLPAAITVNNDLTLTEGILNANNYNIAVRGNWTNNVSATAFTAGTATVTFNGAADQTIGGTFATAFNHLTIADTASTVTLNVNANVGGNLSVANGIFDLSTFTANRSSAGGQLTVANNATLKIGGTNTFPTNYSSITLVVASTVEYSGTNQTVANQLYGNLKLSSATGAAIKTFPATALTIAGNLSSVLGTGTAVSYTAAANITVNGSVSIGASTTFNGGSYAHNIGGNWTNSGIFNGNTSTITFSGAGAAVSGSGTQNFNSLTVAAALITFSNSNISLSGNLATSGSGSFIQASGGTLSMTGTGTTISGAGISLDNLSVSGTVTTTSSLVLTGNVAVSGSFVASAGLTTMSGTAKTISGAGTIGFGVLTVTGSVTSTANFSISTGLAVSGSLSASAGTATFTGTSSVSGSPNLFNVTVNGTSLQLSANAILGIANLLTISAGILDVTSSTPNTINFNAPGAQNINAITYDNLLLSNGNSKTASGAMTMNNSLTIGAGTTFIAGAFTHNIYRDWNNFGTFTAGTGTIQFLGSQSTVVTGATTFNILTVNCTAAAIGVTLQNSIAAATVNMTQGTIYTGTDTLTITTTRTGNGIILGNIQRLHAFSSGVAYAFESPDNLITFAVAIGVTNVVVSVKKGAVSDFPFGGAINRVYNIAVPSGTYVTATLRLHYEDNELNGNSESSMGLWQYNGSTWGAIGKSSNSTTSNYVEQILIPNISNRWTLSDNSNVVVWNGSVSTDWNTAANWTVLQGSASRPPAATDIVNLGTATFTNQPTISTAVTVKNINFGSAKAVTLTMASGGSLTSGDINGTWSSNVTHTIAANNQTITINGSLGLSDGVSGHAINLTIGTGAVNMTGSLTQSGGASIIFSGAGSLGIATDFKYVSGTFTPGTGTVTYSGATNQVVGEVNYYNLTINKSASSASINDTVNIGGNLAVVAGELDNLSTTLITGNVTISSGATLHNHFILHVGGNWNNNGTYTAAGASIFFDGTGTQSISSSTFNNFNVNKPVGTTAMLTGDVVITGSVNIISGTMDVKTFACSRDVPGGAVTLGDSGTIIVGANNAPVNYAAYTISPSSTVIFNGTAAQNLVLPGVSVGNLVFRNSGIKTLFASMTVNGDLTIESGATLDGGSNTVTLYGNWVNNGTFTPSTGTLVCAGASKNLTGATTFNNVTVTGSYTILNDLVFNGLLNITNTGSFTAGSTIHTTLNADLINSGVLYSLGTTTYTGNVVQTLRLVNAITTVALTVNFNGTVPPVLNSTSAPQFGYLNINNTGGINPSVGWTILYSLSVGSGASFNGGLSTHNILGAVTNNGTITSSGTLNFAPSSAATVNLGTVFSSTGTVVFGGAGAMTLAGTPGSFHNLVVANLNATGVTPSSAWNITNNLTVNAGATLNAGSFNHTVGGNLSDSGTINGNTSTFTMNGTAVQNIYSISPFNNLTINNTAGAVTLSSDATVNGQLQFVTGKITTGDNTLIQPASGTVTGAGQSTGWVNGNLKKNIATGATKKNFEIGDGSWYTPDSVAFANVTTAGYLLSSTTPGDHPNIGSSAINPLKSVNRFWTTTNSGIVFSSCTITFRFASADVDAGANPASFVVGGYSGGSWSYPMLDTTTANSTRISNVTSFVDFQIGELTISIKTWDGGAGTPYWGDAANWNTNGVPLSTDNVALNGADTININVAAVTKDLLLNNPGLVLTTNAGNSLAVSGDFTIATGTFNTAAGFPTVTGVIDVSGGTVGFTGTGTQTIPAYNYNNLSSGATGSRILAASGTIGIAGSFTPGSNSYTITGSTINFNGSGAQTIPAFNFNHLKLSNAGVKIFSAATTGVAGVLSITGSATTNTITNAATISYNGAVNQDITAMPYYNLDAASTGGVVTLRDVNVTNNLSVTSGTVSMGDTSATAQKIIVGNNVFVAGGATLNVATISNATHQLTIGGNMTNNGILNLRTDANSLCNATFNKNGIQTLSGSGAITSFNGITLDMGTVNSNYTDVTATNFSAPDGFLTLKNGTFNLNSVGVSVVPFTSDISTGNFLIPASAGLSVNAGTLNAVNMNWTIGGLVKVTGGTLNIGTVADNVAIPMSTANIAMTGGNLNLASAISNPAALWTLNMTGGTMTVNTQGSTAAGIPPFNMDATGASFNVSGGTIVIQQAGGSTGQQLGYNNLATGGTGFTGGTLQIGNASTPVAQTMKIASTNPIYNLTVNSANATLFQTSTLTVLNNVTVTAGALNVDSQMLKIGGGISNSGTFTVSNGTIVMNGTAAQTIPAAAFSGDLIRNLTIDNNAGVTLGGTLNLSDVLLVSNGQLNAGGYLTLLSTAAKTALIDGTGNGEVTGNVTMQRYLPSGFGYKYYSAPFQGATVNEFADDVDLGASFPTFYRYDESLASSGWVTYTTTTNPLIPAQGYAANMGPAPAARTVDATGVVNNHLISSSTLYNHNEPFTSGFNLVGNPYPSPVNWDAASGWTRTNIDNAVYYFDAGTTDQYTGTYSSYINGVSSDGVAGPVIAAMQGFFVHVSDGTYPVAATFTVNNGARINNLVPDFHRRPAPVTAPLLRLTAGLADATAASDPVVVYFDDMATKAFDRDLDALKRLNTDERVPSLYARASDTSRLSICAWPVLKDSTDVIPLGLEVQQGGWITFNAVDMDRIPAGWHIYFYDAKTGVTQNIQDNPKYRIQLDAGNYQGRFFLQLHLRDSLPPAMATGTYKAYSVGGMVYADVRNVPGERCDVNIVNLAGQVVRRRQLNGNGHHELGSGFASGVYIVSFITQRQVFSQKIFISN